MGQEQEGVVKNRPILAWVIVGTLLVLGAVCVVVPITVRKYWWSGEVNEPAAAAALKTYNGMMHTFQKKGYDDQGRVFPRGTGGPSTNRGKYCALYYEINSAYEYVTLIGVSDANADCRADGDTDAHRDQGFYIVGDNKATFTCQPKQGYWYGLCMYRGTMPYNPTNARSHYGMVAFPDDYGATGEATFIVSEDGIVYTLDRGPAGKYLGTFPADPIKEGWEVAK